MASVTTSIDTNAAPDAVWAVMSDPSRFPEWITIHTGWIGDPPAVLDEGSSFGQRLSVMGMPADVKWAVTSVAAPQSASLKGSGPMGIGLKSTYDIKPTASGSSLSWTMEFSGGMVMAVGKQLEAQVGAAQEASLAKLKALLEA